jgi:hypothetical protein
VTHRGTGGLSGQRGANSRRRLVILVIFFAVAFVFLFVLFLVWLLSKEDIGSCQATRTVCIEALWAVRSIVGLFCSCAHGTLSPLY